MGTIAATLILGYPKALILNNSVLPNLNRKPQTNMLNIVAVISSLMILSIGTIVLNAFCLYVIKNSKSLKRKPSTVLILNLLLLHMFQGLFVYPLYAGKKLHVGNILLAKVFANGFRFTYMLAFYSTCLGVMSISMNRFLATILLTRYKQVVTIKSVTIYFICLWLYIISLCLLPFQNLQTDIDQNENNTFINDTLMRPKLYYYNQQKQWTTFMLVFNAALPYVIVVGCYVFIIFRLKQMERHQTNKAPMKYYTSGIEMTEMKKKEPTTTTMKKKKKKKTPVIENKILKKYKLVTYFSLVLSITYAVLWSPSIINFLLLANCKACFPVNYDGSNMEDYVGFIVKYLAFIDSIATPIIYCLRKPEFKKAVCSVIGNKSQIQDVNTGIPTTCYNV